MIRITTAKAMIDVLWPEFEERDGVILLTDTLTPQLGDFASLTEAEAFYSHTHMDDLFTHRWAVVRDPHFDHVKPDPQDPEHALSWTVACSIAEMWMQKLRLAFPEYRFRVYATRYDDPIVRFHRVREQERPWGEHGEMDTSRDASVVVYDTADSRDTETRA